MATGESRPAKKVTSTSAFRTYRATILPLVAQYHRGEISEQAVWDAWEEAKNVLVSYLADAVHHQLHPPNCDAAVRLVEAYPVPVKRAPAPDRSYVPTARLTLADQGEPANEPGDSSAQHADARAAAAAAARQPGAKGAE